MLVGHDAVGGDHSCHIEGLAGGSKGDAPLGSLLTHAGVGNMVVSVESEVAMDFVAHDNQLMLSTEGGQSLKRLSVPADSYGIVWIGENEHFATVVVYFLEVLESML